MQDTVEESGRFGGGGHGRSGQNPDSNKPRFRVSTVRILVVALFVALIMFGLNLPFVRTYVANRAEGDPVTDLAHWVLLALLTLVLTWNSLRNQARISGAGKAGMVVAVGLTWAVIIGWLANDRFNLNDAFDSLDVLANVLLVTAVSAVVVWTIMNVSSIKTWWQTRRDDGG